MRDLQREPQDTADRWPNPKLVNGAEEQAGQQQSGISWTGMSPRVWPPSPYASAQARRGDVQSIAARGWQIVKLKMLFRLVRS